MRLGWGDILKMGDIVGFIPHRVLSLIFSVCYAQKTYSMRISKILQTIKCLCAINTFSMHIVMRTTICRKNFLKFA